MLICDLLRIDATACCALLYVSQGLCKQCSQACRLNISLFLKHATFLMPMVACMQIWIQYRHLLRHDCLPESALLQIYQDGYGDAAADLREWRSSMPSVLTAPQQVSEVACQQASFCTCTFARLSRPFLSRRWCLVQPLRMQSKNLMPAMVLGVNMHAFPAASSCNHSIDCHGGACAIFASGASKSHSHLLCWCSCG